MLKDPYPIGTWFTIGYIPHEVIGYTEDDKYIVAYGYPNPKKDTIKTMTEHEIIFMGD